MSDDRQQTRDEWDAMVKRKAREYQAPDSTPPAMTDYAQQAQELERVKFELGLRNEWAGLHADDVIRLKQQLTASQQEIKRLKERYEADRDNTIATLQARCREMEEKCVHQDLLFDEQDKVTHLKATLTARELELEEYRSLAEKVGASKAVSARDAAVQEVGRLQERMRLIETGGSGPEEAQQARGSSGGDANHYGGQR